MFKIILMLLIINCSISMANTDDPNVTLSKIDAFLYKYYDKSTDVTCYVNYKVKAMECFHKLNTDSLQQIKSNKEIEREYEY